MKLTYTKVGDYLFPNLTIKNQKYKRINNTSSKYKNNT